MALKQRLDLCVPVDAAGADTTAARRTFATASSARETSATVRLAPAARLTRPALNRHVGSITAELVTAGALDRETANNVNADPRTFGPGRALQELLNTDPSPALHEAFDRWMRRFVAMRGRR